MAFYTPGKDNDAFIVLERSTKKMDFFRASGTSNALVVIRSAILHLSLVLYVFHCIPRISNNNTSIH